MRRVKRLITKQRIEKKIEHSSSKSTSPQPSLKQSADVRASGLSDVSSVEDLLLRREGASDTTQNIQISSREQEGYQPPSARCDTLLMGYSENDYTQKSTNTNTNHSNNETNQHTTTGDTTTNLDQPCYTLFNMSHTNTETTMEEIIELDAIPSSAMIITTDIMSPDKILSHHHLGDDEEVEDEISPMGTTTTPRTNLLTQPQQQQEDQSSQELTPEDEQIMYHTLSSCSTLREQLFHLCTLTNDRGQRILRYMLNRQQQQHQQSPPLSDSNNNAGDEKNNNNNNNTTNTPTNTTNNTTTTTNTTQPATTTTTTNNTTFDINKLLDVSRNNTSLMHVCARMNNVGCLEVLHQNGGLIDIQDDLNATPLFYACAHNCQECAVYLLSQGANPNHKDRYGGHSLAICLRNDHLDLMKILVLFNADIHLKGQRGNTCLHLACAEGRIKKVRYLLEDCRASVRRTNRDDEHVLFSALPNIGVIDYLCDSLDQKELTSLLSRVSSFGTTVFHKCCEMGYLDTLMSIMRKYMAKASTDAASPNSNSLAHKKQSLEFLATRLNEGDTTRGYTPLHYAVINERVEVVKFLLSINDIAINHCDLSGDTALHHAIHVGNRAMCDTLIQYGASVRIRNHKNMACWEAARDVDIKLNTSEISALEYLWHRKNKKTSLKKNIHQASLV